MAIEIERKFLVEGEGWRGAVVAKKRIRKGLSTELFLRKAQELSERWAALNEVAEGPPPLLFEGDARSLPRILGSKRMDLILTSPPYGGTYDYAAHHARRILADELLEIIAGHHDARANRDAGEGLPVDRGREGLAVVRRVTHSR